MVDPASLEEVAIRQARGLVDGSVKKGKRKLGPMDWAEKLPPVRDYIFKKAKKELTRPLEGRCQHLTP